MKLVIQDIPGDKLSAEDMKLLEDAEIVSSVGVGSHTQEIVVNDKELVEQIYNLILNKVRPVEKK